MGCVETCNYGLPTLDADLPPISLIFGHSPAMQGIRRSAEQAANANIPILLQGESGTGKEVVARYIHRCSPWQSGPFVKVNCPAIPGTLLESELFGYQRGAFTGAYTSKPGRVEMAHRGTLFLDEIAEIELGLQAKLLQLLQDGHFCRIGAQEERQVEVRVICATNRRLEEEIETGTFRQDLFYRINAVTIELLALRQRSCDIPDLIEYFLELASKKYGRPVRPLSDHLIRRLLKHQWRGNVRELENLVNRYVILGTEDAIIKSLEDGIQNHFDPEIPDDGRIDLKKVTQQAAKQIERKIIMRMLEANCWNRRLTAQALSISYAALIYKMKEAGLRPARPFQKPAEFEAMPEPPLPMGTK